MLPFLGFFSSLVFIQYLLTKKKSEFSIFYPESKTMFTNNVDSNFHKNKNSKKKSINVYNSDYKWERRTGKDWDSRYR